MPGIKLTLAQAAKKQNYAAPNHILIDDRPSNIDQWRYKVELVYYTHQLPIQYHNLKN